MTSLGGYVEYPCERDGSLQSVCPLNGCCKEFNQPPTVQNTNEPVRDSPKMSHQPVGVWSERPAFRENKNHEDLF